MRTLRLRDAFALALVLVSTLSWVTYVAVHLLETGTIRLGGSEKATSSGIWAAGLVGSVFALLLIGYGFRQWLIRPLESMGKAARRIAEGELEVKLPDSRIREISEVREGFDVMVRGLKKSVEQQAALEEERRFFVGAIAHDLRTPLFALRGYLDGLEQGIASTPEQMRKYVAVCQDKSKQLDRLVSDLFLFAKTDYLDTMQPEDEVDLAAVLRQAADSLLPAAQERGVRLRVDASAASCPMKGDAHFLERALLNLLENAVRHSPSGGTVVAGCSPEAGKARVAVRDSGPGFAESELPRAFEPLFRGEASRNRDTGGAGLGLTIARRVFRAHGGELTAANRPEGGAELSGWLPLRRS
ncbi:sensor histidine kinase [Cohnella thailandensis]|uniref:histidine kinase n=1 Tax=Cohnella thailandensis TaxID=557557 RepID=A0A841T3G0_9BACL|nr:HAMP domain-containing sensor histidine kinase [Cohnella thailandensis]MBB6636590.1 HAMP domain-containing histidine kinase [Cohnella thailandensis]MBP1973537.1 signal transduction histidine kinase [Cohnella thailandensis]